jgi:hypothetical protein
MAEENQNQGNEGGGKSDDETLGEGGLSALRAERAENKKLKADLQNLQATLEQHENEKLSKEEQLLKRAETAEARVKELEGAETQRQLREKVAKEADVPADLLTGNDEESLKTSAERLKAFLEETTGPRRPEPNPYAGAAGGEGSDNETEARAVLGF